MAYVLLGPLWTTNTCFISFVLSISTWTTIINQATTANIYLKKVSQQVVIGRSALTVCCNMSSTTVVLFSVIIINVVYCHSSIMSTQKLLLFALFSVWKADRAAVTSLCVSPNGKLLLSAGHVIKMWDLETKEVYRVSKA